MDTKSKEQLMERINKSLDKIRPYLISDGGNVQLEDVSDNMEVKVKLMGACETCPYSTYTLKAGVEQAIKKDIPEINEVIAV